MSKPLTWKTVIPILVLIGLVFGGIYFTITLRRDISEEILKKTWHGYKHYFIDKNGRVKRPKEGDTVSEGQAYAMLRAVWLDDKETFDRCYRWSEQNLSRKEKNRDHLLAWHWKNGKVLDWMPASDADIDYALSLIFADTEWKGNAPGDLEDYGSKAKNILQDILENLTYSTHSGRIYLSPWILEKEKPLARFPVNPSYYSPAHFRIFYQYTQDDRWLKLMDTTYFLLQRLSNEFNGQKGVGLIPDWCSVDLADNLYPLENKNSGFGWEAVRVYFRLALDYYWFDSKKAKDFFASGISPFIEKEWERNGAVFCEYDYEGSSSKDKYESPLFYASYYHILTINNSQHVKKFLDKSRSYLKRNGNRWVYVNGKEYYANSLAWLAEGLPSKVINFYPSPLEKDAF